MNNSEELSIYSTKLPDNELVDLEKDNFENNSENKIIEMKVKNRNFISYFYKKHKFVINSISSIIFSLCMIIIIYIIKEILLHDV